MKRQSLFKQYQPALQSRLSNGNPGIIVAYVGNGTADLETYEAKTTPFTLILEPSDVSAEECNRLFSKAIFEVKNARYLSGDLLELAHRRAVALVSEQSKYVGPASDYIIMGQKIYENRHHHPLASCP